MKAIVIVAVLLFVFSDAKPFSGKRALSCSGFPKQMSARLFAVTVNNDGTSETTDMHFQMDLDQQRFQADTSVNGQQYSIYAFFQEQKFYLVHPEGCLAGNDGWDAQGIPTSFDDIKPAFSGMTEDVSGKLGLNGASVTLYSLNFEGVTGIVTLESGNQCIPVSYAAKAPTSVSTGSFLDIATSVDPEKWKIPEECEQSQVTRSLHGMLNTAHFTEVMRRGFPWINGFTRKRGMKRGFPWK